jgi:hypothetical protein
MEHALGAAALDGPDGGTVTTLGAGFKWGTSVSAAIIDFEVPDLSWCVPVIDLFAHHEIFTISIHHTSLSNISSIVLGLPINVKS